MSELSSLVDRARALYDNLGDRGGLATTLHSLGDVAALEGDLPTALQSALDARYHSR